MADPHVQAQSAVNGRFLKKRSSDGRRITQKWADSNKSAKVYVIAQTEEIERLIESRDEIDTIVMRRVETVDVKLVDYHLKNGNARQKIVVVDDDEKETRLGYAEGKTTAQPHFWCSCEEFKTTHKLHKNGVCIHIIKAKMEGLI